VSFSDKYATTFRRLLPAPFTIAIILTFFTFILALVFGNDEIYYNSDKNSIALTAEFWYEGLWNVNGLAFAVQMMLMLLLGHVLALSKSIDKLLNNLSSYCTSNAKAAFIITFFTILFGLFNWGLGLIFGALFARKIGEYASQMGHKINYAFIGACGYVGMMVFHGGLSGSAPIKVSDKNHLINMMEGVELKTVLPETLPMSETVFSTMNITASIALLIIVPLVMFWVAKKIKVAKVSIPPGNVKPMEKKGNIGMEKADHSKIVGLIVGSLFLVFSLYKILQSENIATLSFLTPNFINFTLLGLGLVMHRNIVKFLSSIDQAIGGVSGILIQFPLYYGIMAIMKDSGLMTSVAEYVSSIATNETFPILTLMSSGALNVLVPSGGGQWIVQGPVLVETSINNGIPLAKTVMAMSYGDQLTNMMQPFWALPLLAITGLKAKEILPYTILLMLIGFIIFTAILIIF
jgi:short-chain fatty acids transporter